MADASSIRKSSSLSLSTDPGATFYKSAIRFYNNQAHVNTGSQWAPLGNTTLSIGFPAAADAVDQNIFVADKAYTVSSVTEAHTTAGTDGSAVTVALMKCTGTQAANGGVNTLTSTFNLKGTANTVQTGTLSATAANYTLAAGDRLALDFTGTMTALAGANITIVLKPV